jgi:hypothetical protein
MINTFDGTATLRKIADRHWMFEIEPHLPVPHRTFANVRGDLRLKRALKRACLRDVAPQRLIDSIKREIRA